MVTTETMNGEEESQSTSEMAKPAPIVESSSPLTNPNAPPPSSSPKDPIGSKSNNVNKAKSCVGCLYYSSQFEADSRNPLCVGFSRSRPAVHRYVVEDKELEALKEDRSLQGFRYACVGYSRYPNRKEQASDGQKSQTELPVCVGLRVLAVSRAVNRRANTAETPSAPSHIHNKEDVNGLPQPQRSPPKPANSTGDDFFSRFTRNAHVVAKGVHKNARIVGNQIKQIVDDILNPYRRRPK